MLLAVPCRPQLSPAVPCSLPQSPVVPCRPPPLTTIPTTNPQSSCRPCILVSQIAVPSSSLKTAVFRFCGRGRHIFCRPVRSRALGSPSPVGPPDRWEHWFTNIRRTFSSLSYICVLLLVTGRSVHYHTPLSAEHKTNTNLKNNREEQKQRRKTKPNQNSNGGEKQ